MADLEDQALAVNAEVDLLGVVEALTAELRRERERRVRAEEAFAAASARVAKTAERPNVRGYFKPGSLGIHLHLECEHRREPHRRCRTEGVFHGTSRSAVQAAATQAGWDLGAFVAKRARRTCGCEDVLAVGLCPTCRAQLDRLESTLGAFTDAPTPPEAQAKRGRRKKTESPSPARGRATDREPSGLSGPSGRGEEGSEPSSPTTSSKTTPMRRIK